jgi:hypothetical protein
LALPDRRGDLPLLCDLTVRALDRLDAAECHYTPANVLHLSVPLRPGMAAALTAEQLYGHVVRRLQEEGSRMTAEPETAPPPVLHTQRPWYFRTGNGGGQNN